MVTRPDARETLKRGKAFASDTKCGLYLYVYGIFLAIEFERS